MRRNSPSSTQKLAANTAAKLTLVFGHHPLAATGNSQDTYLYYGRNQFVGYLNTYGASLYGYGHTHASSESFYTANMTEGVFYFNVSSLGKDSPNQFTVTAIDCNGIASVTQAVGTWPVVLITAPMDKNLGKNVNPYTYSVTNSANNPIRALVFDTGAVNQVQYRIDLAGSWYPMQRTSGTKLSSPLGGLLERLRPGLRGAHHRGPGIHGIGRADGHREGERAGHRAAADGKGRQTGDGKVREENHEPVHEQPSLSRGIPSSSGRRSRTRAASPCPTPRRALPSQAPRQRRS